MESKEIQNWQDNAALKRFQLISPLLDETLDRDKKISLRKEISEKNAISEKSLRRYESAYHKNGFAGLKPMDRAKRRSGKLPENFDELFTEAVILKREEPRRSVRQIIRILELEGRAEPGALKRSTLQKHLFNAGFSVRQMRMYNDARKSSSKRFCKEHRMQLVQADIKYGPKLPIGKNGAYIRTYLSSAIDDHSRYLLHSKFYSSQEEDVIEDTFHMAVLKHGKWDTCYCDNGSQYIAAQLKRSLAMLGIEIRHAPIRSGKSKGKQERFHQVVDAFIREAKLKNITTLEELNRYWDIYLEEYYNKNPHEGIREYYISRNLRVPENGITPEQEWNSDSRPLKFLDPDLVADAFLHHEERLVDKGACISFRGRKYETKPSLIGCTVTISYDSKAPEILRVSYPDMEPFDAVPLKIGAFCDKTPALPLSMQPQRAETSRLLDALEKSHSGSAERRADAISFGSFRKDGGHNV